MINAIYIQNEKALILIIFVKSTKKTTEIEAKKSIKKLIYMTFKYFFSIDKNSFSESSGNEITAIFSKELTIKKI